MGTKGTVRYFTDHDFAQSQLHRFYSDMHRRIAFLGVLRQEPLHFVWIRYAQNLLVVRHTDHDQAPSDLGKIVGKGTQRAFDVAQPAGVFLEFQPVCFACFQKRS